MQEGYGCWCYFGDRHLDRLAKGAPLDEYDRACQHLSWGYECAIVDAEARGEECVPWDVQYEVVPFTAGSDFFSLCEAANAGITDAEIRACAVDACVVETNYVTAIRSLNTDGVPQVDEYYHALSQNAAGFTAADNCFGVDDKASTRSIQCCGSHPDRQPWNSANTGKACCGGEELYNTLTQQCCDQFSTPFVTLGSC